MSMRSSVTNLYIHTLTFGKERCICRDRSSLQTARMLLEYGLRSELMADALPRERGHLTSHVCCKWRKMEAYPYLRGTAMHSEGTAIRVDKCLVSVG